MEAIAADARAVFGRRRVLSALDAGRGEIHAAVYDEHSRLCHGPAAIGIADAVSLAVAGAAAVAGSAAPLLAAVRPELDVGPSGATADIATFARLAAARDGGGTPPRPLYLREADARPQAGFAVPRRAG